MDDIRAHRRTLAMRLTPCVIKPNSLRPGQRVVIFVYDAMNNEAEIVYQGIFQRFRQGLEGLEILLSKIPDDDEVVTDSLAHRGIEGAIAASLAHEMDDASGLILPASVVRSREHQRDNELLIVPIQPNYLIADGKRYSDRNAEDNIASRLWRKLPWE